MAVHHHETELWADDFGFLEGPRWHDDRLFVSDMARGCVVAIDTTGTRTTIAEVPHAPSGLGFLPDGTPLVVSMHDSTVYRIENGGLVPHSDLSSLLAGPANDMVVTSDGRAYVGSFGFDLFHGGAPATSAIALVEPDGSARRVADGLAFPNGLAVTPDGGHLIVAETMGGRLTRFDIGADGGLSNPVVLTDIGEHRPDGICLDREDAVWVALFDTNEVLRIAASGEITDRVKTLARRAVACQLGGADGRTLNCLTSTSSMEDLAAGTGTGQIEVINVRVAGAGSP